VCDDIKAVRGVLGVCHYGMGVVLALARYLQGTYVYVVFEGCGFVQTKLYENFHCILNKRFA